MARPSVVGFLCCCIATVCMIIASTCPVRAVKEFKVGGDSQGWQQPDANNSEIYTLWTSKIRFHVGDSLRFEYNNDSVLVVDKWAYYHCNTSNPSSVFEDGNTVINLDNAGPLYFISGDSEHCKKGQRLEIEVLPLHPIPKYSPPPAPAPHPHFVLSPAPSPFATLSSAAGVVKAVSVSTTLVVAFAFVWLSA